MVPEPEAETDEPFGAIVLVQSVVKCFNAFGLERPVTLALFLDLLPMLRRIIGLLRLFLLIIDPRLINNTLREPDEILTILNARVLRAPLDEILLYQFLAVSIREELDTVTVVRAPLLNGHWRVMA